MHKESKKLDQHAEFDKTGGSVWGVQQEGEETYIGRLPREKMIANALKGNAVVPYEVGDAVLYNTLDSVAEGTIEEIKESSYILQSGSKRVEILHDQVFDKPQGHIF